MSLVVPDSKGEFMLLQYMMGVASVDAKVLKLFSNDVTPVDTSVVGDLTEVSTGTGYAAITLVSANWTTTQASGVTTAVYSERTFTFTTAATSYGYFVTDTSGNLLWLERFTGAPFSIPSGGGTISISPRVALA